MHYYSLGMKFKMENELICLLVGFLLDYTEYAVLITISNPHEHREIGNRYSDPIIIADHNHISEEEMQRVAGGDTFTLCIDPVIL